MSDKSTKSLEETTDVPPKSFWYNRDFLLLWGGQTVSSLGSSISNVALALLVLVLSHSPSQVAFIASVEALPFFFLTLPMGALMDQWNRKRVMFICDLGRAACLGSIAFAVVIGHLTLVQLYVVAIVEGSFATVYNIAALAGVPRVVHKKQLGQATSATYVSGNAVGLIGPPIGSFLFTVARAVPFLADALSYLASVASLLWMRTELQEKREKSGRNILHDIVINFVTGLTWMWKQPVLRFQALGGCIVSLALYPITPLVISLAAQQNVPQASIGIIFTIGALGGIAGGLCGSWIQQRLRFGIIMSVMFGLLALLFLGYLAASNIILLGIVTALIFFVESIGSIANLTYRLALTPDNYQGRINSLHRFVGFGIGRPLGAALLGILLASSGINSAVLVFSGVLVAFALATVLYKPVRTMARIG